MILWSRKRSRLNERINKKLTSQPVIQIAIRVSCILLSAKRNKIIAGCAIKFCLNFCELIVYYFIQLILSYC